MSEQTFGSDTVKTASHDVYSATHVASKQKYAVKLMGEARIGEEGKTVTYPANEAKQQAVLEALATKVGRVLCPGQFTEADVAVDDEENYFVVSKFVPHAFSVRDLRTRNYMIAEERRESIFYLGKADNVDLRTQASVPTEHLKLSGDLKTLMQRDGFTVADALVSGRIDLKMALYILGEKDELLNRDGNVLLAVKSFDVNNETKIITPKVMPVAVDCGLCFGRTSPKNDIVEKAFKLAVRTQDSNKMGLELNGLPPSNLKSVKDKFLTGLTLEKLTQIEKHVSWAAEHLDAATMKPVEDMLTRYTTCYLAGQCIKAGLDKPEKENEAKMFLRDSLGKLNQRESAGASR